MSAVSRQDVYIRLNEDPDKDYCFAVNKDWQVADLKKIFERIPVILSPNYFYSTVPKGFRVSAHPGFLTSQGAMLFHWEADCEEFLAPVDQLAQIKDAIVPGSLIVPTWDFQPHRYYTILGLLAVWWYLDWPDFLSPTPGNQPTVLLGKALAPFSPAIAKEVLAPDAFEGKAWAILFFAMHTLKVLLIWVVFRVGIINVRTLNPFKRQAAPTAADIDADMLSGLGWTGVRRMLPDTWKNKYRDHVIEQHGGVVKAYASGALDIKDGLELEQDEGWAVLRKQGTIDKVSTKNFLQDGRFVVSDEYLVELSKYSTSLLASKGDDIAALDQTARQVREYGFLEGPPKLKEMYLKLEAERNPKRKVPEKTERPGN